MIRCRDASRLISESQERPLGLLERLRLRVHLILCRACARFQDQTRLLGTLCGHLDCDEESEPPDGAVGSAESLVRIRARLKK
jgi:hypothetical protein